MQHGSVTAESSPARAGSIRHGGRTLAPPGEHSVAAERTLGSVEGMRSRPGLALTVATLGYLLVLLDVTIVNVALESIATGLHADRAELQWVVDAYALALASLMLSAGQLADAFGRRRVFGAGMALFGAGSVACALAPS